ncbi:hypothetical protein BSKO_07486 [Bryopsis sp. KO-2023]|nr:hypothetical protein BSKO_07486 [Bryopsis sp. KO-2023]
MHNTKDVNSVCVIGGGVAGLVTAKALLSRGFSVSLFEERGEIGGLWSDNYYNVAVQADKLLYEYPEKAFPENVSRLASATEILAYLNEFAKEHNLLPCCKLRHKIVEVSRPKETVPWTATYTNSGGEILQEEFDFVVVCTGLLGKPSIPDFHGLSCFKGRVLHSTEWKSPQEFHDKKVVVIGNGKGATDAVVGALSPARQVHQVCVV